jgi:hypothetical protein
MSLGPVRNPVLEHRVRLFSLVVFYYCRTYYNGSSRLAVPVCVCVCFITAGPITKLVCVTKLFASQGRCVPSIFLLNLERCGLAILPQKDVSSKG